jgi:hypothetical protein
MFGYSLLRANLNGDYFNALMDETAAFGIPIEGLHTETGPGVYEAAILFSEALEAADRAILFKTGAKEIVSVDALSGVYDPDNPSGTARYPSTLAPQKRYDWKLTVKTGSGTQKQVSFSCTPDEVKAAAASAATGTTLPR